MNWIGGWGKTAETIAQWFDKGDLITVAGTLQNDSYETENEKYFTDQIIVREFHFNGNKKSAEPNEADTAAFDELLNDPAVTF